MKNSSREMSSSFTQASRAKRHDLAPRIKHSWNQWAMQVVHGHVDRLIPVTQIDLNDVPKAINEMTRMRKLGSRAFAIGESPVGVRSPTDSHQLARSLTHPDFEPLWSAAEDLGMAAVAHVGFGRERIQFGWANNGASDLTTYSLLSLAIAPQLSPQLLLGALVFDGVLERHPKLTVIVEELGISWLPHLLQVLDSAVGQSRNEQLSDGQISKLVGSTKGTVSLIRKRSYWNFSNLKAKDPVILGLCSQNVFEKSLEKSLGKSNQN